MLKKPKMNAMLHFTLRGCELLKVKDRLTNREVNLKSNVNQTRNNNSIFYYKRQIFQSSIMQTTVSSSLVDTYKLR